MTGSRRDTPPGPAATGDPDRVLAAALAAPARRVGRLDLPDGRVLWLKRVERPRGVQRLLKGDPARALAAERAGLRALAAAGVPVAEVVREGPDWILLADAGPTLVAVAADPAGSVAQKRAAFAGAGLSLARLHSAGLAHGRPAVRDICWDGRVARFIDLERFRAGRRGAWWQATDMVMFVQTCFTQWPEDSAWAVAALAAYATAAPPRALRRIRWLGRALAPLGWLARGLCALRPRSRELRAAPLALALLRRFRG